jgi:hypothetical protein
MKQQVNFYAFRDAFKEIRPNNFSYEGLTALFDYLENYEQDTGEEIELDVISLCCDYCEESISDIIANYEIEIDQDQDKLEQVKEYLEYNTTIVSVLEDQETIIYQVF